MQHSLNSVIDENEELSSFCSSCKSVLQSICGIGELFSLDELMNDSVEEVDVQIQTDENENTVGTIDAINKKTNEYTLNNHETNYNETDSPIHKKIRYIASLDESDAYITSDTKSNFLINTSSIKDSIFTTRKKEANNVAQHILDRRKSILKIAQSILCLSNYIDGMRKVILQEIHEKQSVRKYQQNSSIKPLTSQGFPMYNYDLLRVNKK